MRMNYIVVGTNDLLRATQFYDSLFENNEIVKINTTDRMTFWSGDSFVFAVALPFDGFPATKGNGTTIGFSVNAPEEVNNIYRKAVEMGGNCAGEPNTRGPVYSGYVRDLDDNKLCIYYRAEN